MRRFIITLVCAITFSIANASYGQNILIWDNDLDSWFYPLDTPGFEGCEAAIQRALLANNLSCTITKSLPSDLSDYDVIFVVFGFGCPS